MSRGPLRVWSLQCRESYHPHMVHPSPSYVPCKLSHLPTRKILKSVIHLWFRQGRWDKNLHMVDHTAYPMLSTSPLKISVRCLLILGCNKVSIKWQDEGWASKGLSPNAANHAGPNISTCDELVVIHIWNHVHHMAHLIK